MFSLGDVNFNIEGEGDVVEHVFSQSVEGVIS